MTSLALVAVSLAEYVVGLTARERFQAVQQLDSGGFMTSRGFTIAMVVVLVVSIVALVIVSLRTKIREIKAAEKKMLSDIAAKKALAESEAASLSTSAPVASAEEPDAPVTDTAFIAIFPFTKEFNGGRKQSQQDTSPPQSGTGAEWSRQLPEFLPATVTGIAGQVIFLETTLAANVGDRVLIAIGPASAGEGAGRQEFIEDIGLVQQSTQPAELMKEPNARRLGIELNGLNEAQTAQLAGVIGGATKTTGDAKADAGGLKEAVETAPQPVGSEEGSK